MPVKTIGLPPERPVAIFNDMTGVLIRALEQNDYAQWLSLWSENNGGHCAEDVTACTWQRLNDKRSPVNGLVAEGENGHLAGLVHYILHPVTGHLNDACYMQDLFVNPQDRRQGIARTLVTGLAALGRQEQWARLYWLADKNNAAAQALYRTIGLKLDFTFYIMPLS